MNELNNPGTRETHYSFTFIIVDLFFLHASVSNYFYFTLFINLPVIFKALWIALTWMKGAIKIKFD